MEFLRKVIGIRVNVYHNTLAAEGVQWLFLNNRMSFGIGIGMEMNLTITKTVLDLQWRDVNYDVFRVTGLINLGVSLQ